MEIKLENLIEKIKTQGVAQAVRLSGEIESKAKQDARKIIEDARIQAQSILENAKQEANKAQANVTAALQQTARDVALAVKEQIALMFENILNYDLSGVLSNEFVKEMIIKIVENWASDKENILEVVVSEKDKENLQDLLFSKFKDKLKTTVEIKVSPNIDKGFRIGVKGKDLHYDFTQESILEVFKVFLSPAVKKILFEL